MVSRVTMAPSAESLTVVERAEVAIAAAADHLALPHPDPKFLYFAFGGITAELGKPVEHR